MGDIGGFRHDDFNVSPPAGMFTNPVATTVRTLDWAGQNPSVIVRTQSPNSNSTSPCNFGAYSLDGGTTWKPSPTCAVGVADGGPGTLAIDAGGTIGMWSPDPGSSPAPQFTTDIGNTWTAVTGLPAQSTVYADKVTPRLFYAYVSGDSSGDFYSGTVDPAANAAAFTKVNTTALPTSGNCYGSGCGVVDMNWAKAGEIWLPLGSNGLFHSTDGGMTWTKVANVPAANSVAVGAANPGCIKDEGSNVSQPIGCPQAVFLYGKATRLDAIAIYRSDDNGKSWLRVNDDKHQYGGPTLIQADPRVYGRVYLVMNGRGIIYGDQTLLDDKSDEGHSQSTPK